MRAISPLTEAPIFSQASQPQMQAPSFNFNIKLGRRGGADVVGLDIQPGHVAAVEAHVNGGITVKQAAGASLPADIVREGEVLDEGVLAETLRELFKDGGLSRHVRLGVANQRTVLRTLDLPPVDDRKEIEAAVRFQAQDQVPMPLSNAVLDFQSQVVNGTTSTTTTTLPTTSSTTAPSSSTTTTAPTGTTTTTG